MNQCYNFTSRFINLVIRVEDQISRTLRDPGILSDRLVPTFLQLEYSLFTLRDSTYVGCSLTNGYSFIT